MISAAGRRLLAIPDAPRTEREGADAAARPATVEPSPEAIYETHFDRVWRNLRRLGVDEAALEDATQDVFITVFRKFDTWDRDRSTVDTWVFGVLRKVASRYRRGSKRRLLRFFPWTNDAVERASSPSAAPDDAMEKKEATLLLERLLASIEPAKRELVVLVDVEQLSVVEAAEALGINLNTAYSRLRAGRELFSSALSRHLATERRIAAAPHSVRRKQGKS